MKTMSTERIAFFGALIIMVLLAVAYIRSSIILADLKVKYEAKLKHPDTVCVASPDTMDLGDGWTVIKDGKFVEHLNGE